MVTPRFVRFCSPTPNDRGVRVGVFALANGLARAGVLDDEEHERWRRSNDWFEAAYSEPTLVDPTAYDRSINPGAVAWFKVSAVELIERTMLYTGLLDAHHVAWERVETEDPGWVIYKDAVQVIAVHRANTMPLDGSSDV